MSREGNELNSEKVDLKCGEVAFHGHLLTLKVLKPDPEKTRAIVEMPRPEKQDDILCLNSIASYLSHFLPL